MHALTMHDLTQDKRKQLVKKIVSELLSLGKRPDVQAAVDAVEAEVFHSAKSPEEYFRSIGRQTYALREQLMALQAQPMTGDSAEPSQAQSHGGISHADAEPSSSEHSAVHGTTSAARQRLQHDCGDEHGDRPLARLRPQGLVMQSAATVTADGEVESPGQFLLPQAQLMDQGPHAQQAGLWAGTGVGGAQQVLALQGGFGMNGSAHLTSGLLSQLLNGSIEGMNSEPLMHLGPQHMGGPSSGPTHALQPQHNHAQQQGHNSCHNSYDHSIASMAGTMPFASLDGLMDTRPASEGALPDLASLTAQVRARQQLQQQQAAHRLRSTISLPIGRSDEPMDDHAGTSGQHLPPGAKRVHSMREGRSGQALFQQPGSSQLTQAMFRAGPAPFAQAPAMLGRSVSAGGAQGFGRALGLAGLWTGTGADDAHMNEASGMPGAAHASGRDGQEDPNGLVLHTNEPLLPPELRQQADAQGRDPMELLHQLLPDLISPLDAADVPRGERLKAFEVLPTVDEDQSTSSGPPLAADGSNQAPSSAQGNNSGSSYSMLDREAAGSMDAVEGDGGAGGCGVASARVTGRPTRAMGRNFTLPPRLQLPGAGDLPPGLPPRFDPGPPTCPPVMMGAASGNPFHMHPGVQHGGHGGAGGAAALRGSWTAGLPMGAAAGGVGGVGSSAFAGTGGLHAAALLSAGAGGAVPGTNGQMHLRSSWSAGDPHLLATLMQQRSFASTPSTVTAASLQHSGSLSHLPTPTVFLNGGSGSGRHLTDAAIADAAAMLGSLPPLEEGDYAAIEAGNGEVVPMDLMQ